MIIVHASGHGLVANSRALRLAAIDKNTPDPNGGTIERDAQGQPTGVLTENAMRLVRDLIPPLSVRERADAFARGARHVASLGITSAVEASAEWDDLDALRLVISENALSARCQPWLLGELLAKRDFPAPNDIWSDGDDLVTVDTMKLFSDGALGTRTALLRAPYADTPGSGTAIWEQDALVELVKNAYQAGWRIATHAIGDSAIDRVLDAYAQVPEHNRTSRRLRVEHAMLLHDDQIRRMRDLSVLPVFQPEFIARFGDAYIAGLGEERARNVMPYQSALSAGLPLIFSSDLPVVSGSPLAGMAAAMQRRTPAGFDLGPEQRVSYSQALAAYTSGAAYSLGLESSIGALSPGQGADFIVLSEDPSAIAPDEWPDRVQVLLTCVNGRVTSGDWDALAEA